MKPTRIELQFFGLLQRILKSVSFNVAMIIVGFVSGFLTLLFHYHYVALSNSVDDFIPRLEKKIDDLERMDREYTEKEEEIRELLKEIRVKLIVEESNLKIK